MKNYTLLILALFLIKTYSYGQYPSSTNDITVLTINATNQINNTFIPPNPQVAGKVSQEATIIVNFINGNGTSEQWTNEAKAAFEYAAGLWEKAIYSDEEIRIDAYFTPLATGQLGNARASDAWENFSVSGVNTDLFENDYYYVQALANKLHQADISSDPDLIANFNSNNTNFYFGTDGACPNTKYDFVTVVLHEIAHGLGFTSNFDNQSGAVEYRFGANDNPFIYTKFLREGSTNITDMGSPSTQLTNAVISDNIFWENYKIFAPTASYIQGSSIGHLDAVTYQGTANSLMTPGAKKGPGVHDLGLIGIDIMEKIGWGEVFNFITGSNSNSIALYPHHFMIYNWTDNTWSSDNVPYHILRLGGDYTFDGFRLAAYHENGIFYINGSYDDNSLPDNYNWKRDSDGYVQGYIENYICNDCPSVGEKQKVKFEKAPNIPSFEIIPSVPNQSPYVANIETCNELEFNFYSEDALSYTIKYKSENDLMGIGVIVPDDVYNYTITGLDENLDYEFTVEARNAFGFTKSTTYNRPRCSLRLIAFPNPTVDVIRIKDEDNNTVITNVEVVKVDNPNIRKESLGNSDNEVDVNVVDLPNGVYNIKVTDDKGTQSSKIFIKY